MVGVVAHLRGEVERGGEAGLTGGKQHSEAGVGILGGAEAGVLPHGPEPAGVHRGLNAPEKGPAARLAGVSLPVGRCV